MQSTRISIAPIVYGRWISRQHRSFSQHIMSYETFYPKLESNQSQPTHVIGFLHGILGNKKNWRTPAKTFIRQHPEYAAFSADLRGHGDSGQLTKAATARQLKNSVHSCALDLQNLMLSHDFQQTFPQLHNYPHNKQSIQQNCISNYSNFVLSGHSFGGKVVLEFLHHLTRQSPAPGIHHNNFPKTVYFNSFILDSIPDFFEHRIDDELHRHQSVYNILSILKNAPKVYASKEEALHYLQETNKLNPFIGQWLLMNLAPVVGTNAEGKEVIKEWSYTFDIDGILELFDSFTELSYLHFLENFNMHADETSEGRPRGKIIFVRSGKNPFWNYNSVDEKLKEICRKNPHIVYVTMPHVGHWLHSEDLLGLLKLMNDYLPQSK